MITDLSIIMDVASEKPMSNVGREIIEVIRANGIFVDAKVAELAKRNLEDELTGFESIGIVGDRDPLSVEALRRRDSQLRLVDAYLLGHVNTPNQLYCVYRRDIPSGAEPDDI